MKAACGLYLKRAGKVAHVMVGLEERGTLFASGGITWGEFGQYGTFIAVPAKVKYETKTFGTEYAAAVYLGECL